MSAGFVGRQGAKSGSVGFDKEVSPTLRQGITTDVCYCLQGNGIDRADTAGCNGKGWRENECYTLNTIDRPAVVFDITGTNSNSMKSSTPDSCSRKREVARTLDTFVHTPECNQGGNVVVETCGALCARDYKGVGSQYVEEGKVIVEPVCIGNGQLHQISMAEQSNCLDCMHDRQAVLIEGKPSRKYILRRLTPLECCRLQGFPDWWEDGVEGSDSARYKMWGNGMALPNMLFVMQRIAKREVHNDHQQEKV